MSCEFSLKTYRSLLEAGQQAGYRFLLFDEAGSAADDKFCLMRHDIDADLDAALRMARVEKDCGVRTTYFVMLRSPVYNLFGRYNHRCVEEIIASGHRIALHYDEGFYPGVKKELQELVEEESAVLETVFGQKITTVSFHQPGAKILSNEIRLRNFINTYDKKDLEGIFYMSDSNMNWKNKDPWEIFKSSAHRRIQILTHPMWWMGDGSQGTERLWDKALLDNINRTLDQIMETEAAFGKRRLIDLKHPPL